MAEPKRIALFIRLSRFVPVARKRQRSEADIYNNVRQSSHNEHKGTNK